MGLEAIMTCMVKMIDKVVVLVMSLNKSNIGLMKMKRLLVRLAWSKGKSTLKVKEKMRCLSIVENKKKSNRSARAKEREPKKLYREKIKCVSINFVFKGSYKKPTIHPCGWRNQNKC